MGVSGAKPAALLRPVRTKKVNRSLGGNVAVMILLAAMGLFMVLPLVYVVCNAFKPLDELFLFPPRFFVRKPTGQNFIDLFNLMSGTWVPFSRYIFNTVFITVCGTLGHVILASMAAYVLARHQFPGSKAIFRMIVLSLMFSASVTQVPNYLTMAQLGLVDTYLAVILPAFSSSLGLYLMKQFMEQVSESLLEAARLDGASEYRIFWSVMMPIVKPAWMTLIILQIQSLWNLTSGYLYSEELKTLSQALNQIVHGGIARAGAAGAVGLLMIVVPIVAFVVSQSQIIETMGSSGMKD